jgi:hypothetical protein
MLEREFPRKEHSDSTGMNHWRRKKDELGTMV